MCSEWPEQFLSGCQNSLLEHLGIAAVAVFKTGRSTSQGGAPFLCVEELKLGKITCQALGPSARTASSRSWLLIDISPLKEVAFFTLWLIRSQLHLLLEARCRQCLHFTVGLAGSRGLGSWLVVCGVVCGGAANSRASLHNHSVEPLEAHFVFSASLAHLAYLYVLPLHPLSCDLRLHQCQAVLDAKDFVLEASKIIN